MKFLARVILVVLALCGPARADEAAIRAVISGQIEAFQADDFGTAFEFASPTIQRIFRDPENFGTMVRQGYPMVWRPVETKFLGVDMIGGQLWQNVLIRDQKGELHILEYQMINSEMGGKSTPCACEKILMARPDMPLIGGASRRNPPYGAVKPS